MKHEVAKRNVSQLSDLSQQFVSSYLFMFIKSDIQIAQHLQYLSAWFCGVNKMKYIFFFKNKKGLAKQDTSTNWKLNESVSADSLIRIKKWLAL